MALWEEVLTDAIDMKRLTHLSLRDKIDRCIAEVLVKLHRYDDALAFIRHWLDWHDRRSHPHLAGLRSILDSRKGEWSYPCEDNCRLLSRIQRPFVLC